MHITELILYPIKGCAGISLSSAKATSLGLASPSGLLRDRTWVISRPGGRMVTQRIRPEICLIKTRIEPVEAIYDPNFPVEDAFLVLSAPKMPELKIPLAQRAGRPVEDITIWNWSGTAYDEGKEAAEWFTKYLRGMEVKLLRYGGKDAATAAAPAPPTPSSFQRPVEARFAPKDGTQETAFADGFPYLIATNPSLDDLNHHLGRGQEIPMNRFRPNIVIAGDKVDDAVVPKAWDEDGWYEVKLADGVVLRNVKPCSRCKVPTINQATGVEEEEPARTLMRMRSGRALGWTQSKEYLNSMYFGSNMCMMGGEGEGVAVGDSFEVLSLLPSIPVAPVDGTS